MPASRQTSTSLVASSTPLSPQARKNSLPPPNVPAPKLRAEETLAAIQVGHAFVERPMQQHARGQYIAALEKAQSGEGPRRLNKGDLSRIQSMLPVRVVGTAADD